MDASRKTKISRFLSYVLRHKPDEIGLVLDPDGWADVDDLIARVKDRYADFDEALLRQIVQEDEKQRYALLDGNIRAQQGHSIEVREVGSERVPPEILYHGTTKEKWAAIQADEAIRPMSRQHVHLSKDVHTAIQVASRRRNQESVILKVHAAAMHEEGYKFRLTDNQVWLTQRVPIEYVEIVE